MAKGIFSYRRDTIDLDFCKVRVGSNPVIDDHIPAKISVLLSIVRRENLGMKNDKNILEPDPVDRNSKNV